MTQTKQTQDMAIQAGFQVKKNAVVFIDCKPAGILIRRPGEKDFYPFYFEGVFECQPTNAQAKR